MNDARMPVPLAQTLAAYDLWATAYDAFDNPLVAMTERALDHLPLRVSGRRVVELGCGTGRNARRVLAAGASAYLGVDGSAGMLERARAHHADPRATFVQADLSSPLPLHENCADDVLITLVLEHVPDLVPLFRQVRRLLAPGGTLRIIEIHNTLVEGGVQAHFWHDGTEYRLASFPHDAHEYVRAFLAAGLEPSSVTEWFATHEAELRIPKLAKHRGRPILLDVMARRP